MKRKQDLMYSSQNLDETVTYCKYHNPQLLHRNTEALHDDFWSEISRKVGGLYSHQLEGQTGRLLLAYNAWFVIDTYTPQFHEREWAGPYMINFFVRLGRRPLPMRARLALVEINAA